MQAPEVTVESQAQAWQDAEHLRLLSIGHYVMGGMMALWACFPILHFVIGTLMVFGTWGEASKGGPPPALVGSIFMGIAGALICTGATLATCTVLAGRKLSRRQGYMFCLVVAAVMAAMCVPFGTILGVFTIIVLVRPSVKQAFGQPA